MFNVLFSRTFIIVGGMLLITAIGARINKAFETGKEMFITIIGTFIFLFAVIFFANSFPVNIIMVGIFSGLMGWQIGPMIEFYGKKFKLKKFLKEKNVILKKGEFPSKELTEEFEKNLLMDPHANEWHNIVFQALLATAMAVFATSGIVFFTNIDFSFLQGFLFIALIILILMGIGNAIFFKSRIFSIVKAYFGVMIFTLYLLYDFNQLEKMANDETWGAAVNIAVSIYLDIINLFLYILEILSDSSD